MKSCFELLRILFLLNSFQITTCQKTNDESSQSNSTTNRETFAILYKQMQRLHKSQLDMVHQSEEILQTIREILDLEEEDDNNPDESTNIEQNDSYNQNKIVEIPPTISKETTTTTTTAKTEPNSYISRVCSYGICIDDFEDRLYTDGATYHLIANLHKPRFALLKEKEDVNPIQPKCALAVIVATMPHSGDRLQTMITEEILRGLKLKLKRPTVYWNFHAHSKLSDEDSAEWIGKFDSWYRKLTSIDVVVIRAPYKDDTLALEICKKSIVIAGYRGYAEDLALLRYLSPFVSGEEEGDYSTNAKSKERMTLDYIRSILHHHKYWSRKSKMNLRFDDMIDAESDGNGSLESFVERLCLLVAGNVKGKINDKVCTDDDFVRSVLSSNNVVNEIEAIRKQERELLAVKDTLSKDMEELAFVEKAFQSWDKLVSMNS